MVNELFRRSTTGVSAEVHREHERGGVGGWERADGQGAQHVEAEVEREQLAEVLGEVGALVRQPVVPAPPSQNSLSGPIPKTRR
jgi:hypothetical protein